MVVRYRNLVQDSQRWEGFEFRPDDIVISTPAKCGTTWTQMLCALLIFDSSEFDRPLAHISPWLDMQTRDLDDVLAELEAQTHRRFIKTHTPLDGLPSSEGVTLVCVGRDPREVALSWDHHMDNTDRDAFIALRAAAVGLEDLAELGPLPEPPSTDATERYMLWIESPADGGSNLASVLHHFETFWDRRQDDDVVLLHYSDLTSDLCGQMRRLADGLQIDVSDARIEELAVAASFDQMRARAEVLAPNSDQGFWKSTEGFFHRGRSGEWGELLDDETSRRYEERVHELVPDDIAAWAHQGSLGAPGRTDG